MLLLVLSETRLEMAMWIKTVAAAGWILMVSIAGGVVAMHAYY